MRPVGRDPRSWGERLAAGVVSLLVGLVALDIVAGVVSRLLGPLLPVLVAMLVVVALVAAVFRRY